MRSSDKRRAVATACLLLTAIASPTRATAQLQAKGFAADRFYPSAPGGGWFVMDALDMRGGLGGAAALTASYARNPLRVRASDGSQHLNVVSEHAIANFGFTATYDRFRLYLDLGMPLLIKGSSGTVGRYSFTGPEVDPGTDPDSLSDPRIGFDARLLGTASGPFRLGAGAQLFVPNIFNDTRDHYDTDGTYRAMGRVLFAGDLARFTYAGHLGVHLRPLDDAPSPGSPQGSEMLFGAAAGAKMPLGRDGTMALIVGPEVYGATAFKSFFGSDSTALEGLLTGRLEGTADDGAQMRVKLGPGIGMNHHFGAAEWRFVFGIELFDRSTDRDNDGVSNSKDACPDTPGMRTRDPRTNGCPAVNDPPRLVPEPESPREPERL